MMLNLSYNNNQYPIIKINLVQQVLWIYKNKFFHKIREIGKKMGLKKEKEKVQPKLSY